MPRVEYIGFDVDQRVIHAAIKKYGHRGRFLCKDLDEVESDLSGAYDIILATGVVHHLDDDQAARMLNLARKCLKSGARLVTLDGCYVEGQSYLSRLMLSLDRGKYVRNKEQYLRLAGNVFEHVEATVYDDLLRIPSTILVMECHT
jgi:2-polyprenyl-3-methyl-5-hydroxy-6-metoxy-1,4-benzoquinol methylase